MKKVSMGFIFTGMVCLAASLAPQAHAAADSLEIMVDNQIVQFPDAKPFIDENGRTQVPVRFVADQLGFKVNWKLENGSVKVMLAKDAKSIVLKEGETVATINGQPVSLDSSVMIKNDRTFVPLRFIAESVGKYVNWDENRNAVSISSDKPVMMMADVSPTPLKPATRSLNDENKPSITSQASSMIAYAEKYIGVPYVWGGTSPDGFDCSGFVQYVFNHFGVQLPRTASDMYSAGTPVSSLQPGDLVFFSTYAPGASHVGIYIGNNEFISATSSHGVKICNLNDPYYWGPRYIGARRF
jgi:peptidoglycan endopeptidase LytE